MYLESVVLEKNIPVLQKTDPVFDLFKELEEKIERQSGRPIRLLPERAYKGGILSEPDYIVSRDEDGPDGKRV